MTTPISFTIRPPSAPFRPSPLGNGQSSRNGSSRAGPPSRRHFEQVDQDDDEEEQGEQRNDEKITGLVNGMALGGQKEPKPLIIAPLPNRDWRQSSMANGARRAPSYRPETSRSNDPIETYERVGDGPQLSGLRFASKAGKEEEINVKVEQETGDSATHTTLSTFVTTVKSESLTLEEQALQAILRGGDDITAEDQAQKDLIIGMTANEDSVRAVDEADAFRRDVATRPEESTMDDYASVPVSAFGLAIVRGMGYDPSMESPIHIPKARPHLLGIGATPLDVPPPTSGSKKKGDDYKKRTGRGYVPNVLIRKERESSGSVTPVSSRRTSPGSEGSRRDRDREDRGRDRDSRDMDRRGKSDRDNRYRQERETFQERAERKERERDDRYQERDLETDDDRARRKAREKRERDDYHRGSDREDSREESDRYRWGNRDRRRDDKR